MNNYLIKSTSIRLQKEEISKIIKESDNIINFNYEDTTISNIVEECNYLNLLEEKKIVIVNNYKLSKDDKVLEEYLDNFNPNTILILVTNILDKKNPLCNKLNVIEINELKYKDLDNKVLNYCKKNDIEIDYMALKMIIDYNLSNYDLILNEIDKIAIVTNKITTTTVNDYSSDIIKTDNFDLVEAIINKDNKKIGKLLPEFISSKSDVFGLIGLLASNYRIMITVKKIDKSPETLAKMLDIHPYRVKLAKEKSFNYTIKELTDNLIKLSNLDYKLKTLNTDPYILLKVFLTC